MPIQSIVNQYLGINAHLHSLYQLRGGWQEFHAPHIVHLGEEIQSILPAGYAVGVEQSLQIRETDFDTGAQDRSRTQPDIAVYETSASRPSLFSPASGSAAALVVVPLAETLEQDEDLYAALVIYQVDEITGSVGRPVTRIELLSPSNKEGEGAKQYREKRFATVKSGVSLVEIDYLHETGSPVKVLPRYPHEAASYPYFVTVSNPHTDEFEIYRFHVDDPIPDMRLPLSGRDAVTVNLNRVYHRTFRSLGVISLRVDYERLPEHFERYSPFDQQRIHARMALVADLHRQGVRLENGPFPIPQEHEPGKK